ncbi:hypothetical protein GBA52_010348 [Prunus armeniaca]|nr:hypothetical protein GBA52_010348 [Prunus armeniaca]
MSINKHRDDHVGRAPRVTLSLPYRSIGSVPIMSRRTPRATRTLYYRLRKRTFCARYTLSPIW